MKKVLKLLAVSLALAIFASTATITASAEKIEFTDVDKTDYFYPAVQWGLDAGITQGVGDNLFAPDGEVTRAQVVTFLWNMAGKPDLTATETFDDVEKGSWYETAVAWAVESEITAGTGEGKFSPDTICDRAMCISLLYRMMGAPMDGIDLTATAGLSEDTLLEEMTMEEFGNALMLEMITSFHQQNIIEDVAEGTYYDLPVIWACLNGIVTENNTDVSEERILFRPTQPCVRKEMISFLYQTKLMQDAANAPAEVYFGDYVLPIPQEYFMNELLSYEMFGLIDDDEYEGEDEVAIIVSERASKEAAEAMGEDTEGQGELFRIVRVGEDRLHEMLTEDMSGIRPFAKDEKGIYYLFCTPTDVRYVRETAEKMKEDIDRWTELNSWANEDVIDGILAHNYGLLPVSFTNTMLDMYLARIAYAKDIKYTISAEAYGPLGAGDFDGTRYAEYLLGGNFVRIDDAESPAGGYVELNFTDEGVRYDFFIEDQNLVRELRDGHTAFYRRAVDGNVTNTEAMEGWYFALAEQTGKKEDYKEIDPFLGEWTEEYAGRGVMTITKSVGLMKADIEVRWPGSAFEIGTWSITANLAEDGNLVYSNGKSTITQFDEYGKGTVIKESSDQSGTMELNEGKLIWKTDDGEESSFVKSN